VTWHGATDKQGWVSRGPGVSDGVREGERRVRQRGRRPAGPASTVPGGAV
jgi:hypothetical protein